MKQTPLKRKTTLKAKTSLKQYTSLKAKKSLSQKSTMESTTPIKVKQKTARKRKEPYFSIFTTDMSCCIITGDTRCVVRIIFLVLAEKHSQKNMVL